MSETVSLDAYRQARWLERKRAWAVSAGLDPQQAVEQGLGLRAWLRAAGRNTGPLLPMEQTSHD